MVEIPASMVAELARWNNGAGIDLEGYVAGTGSFSLAVGYSTLFWPRFVVFEDYILHEGTCEQALRGFEDGRPRASVEWLQNHIHLAHLHCSHPDTSGDKLLLLGEVLREIYPAKLRWQYPERPCAVEFLVPEHRDRVDDDQLSFWQVRNETLFTSARTKE